jgi:hypothetical protein
MTVQLGQPKRPGPVRWLCYSYGAGLPARFDEWVLRDTTSRTWVLRHLTHAMVQLAPVLVAALIFVPGPAWIRIVGAIAATAMALLFSLAYMVETSDRRLTKAGYPSGLGEQVRRERSASTRTQAVAARQAKVLERRASRDDRRTVDIDARRVR